MTDNGPRFRVRISRENDPELYCGNCRSWLPISVEFWPARDRLSRCRACEAERSRLYQARRAFDPEFRLKQYMKSLAYRAYLKGVAPELLAVEATLRREAANRRARIGAARRAGKAGSPEYNRAWMAARRSEKAA